MAIAELRAGLRRAGIAEDSQPDDGTLQVLLDAEGSIAGAIDAVVGNQAAESRISAESFRPPADERGVRTAAPGGVAATSSWVSVLWRVLSLPFSLVHAAVVFILRLFRAAPRDDNVELTRFAQDPGLAAHRFVDSLERDVNGTTIPADARDEHTHMLVQLPPFLPRAYSEALQLAKQEHRILAIILSSPVHADDAHFRSRVLTDATLVDALSTRDFVVWGGSVADREANRVATLLEASTYPFVAFIALQPRRSRTSAVITSKAAVLSRIEGSPHSATSAAALVSHIREVLVPRAVPYLERLRGERQRRESERALMAEQDRAFEAAARRDAERVLQARAESERAAQLADARQQAAIAAAADAHRATQWRRWAKTHLVPPEPVAEEPAIRLSVHVPDGRNLQRRFRPTDTLESVYIYVDTAAEAGDEATKPDYIPTYGFRLVQTYPRAELGHELMSRPLDTIDGLGSAARLLAEGNVGGHVPSSSSEME